MRVFGWMKLVDEAGKNKEFQLLAPDITDAKISLDYLLETFTKRKQPVKQVIMDNTVVAGVGNIYASDALHLAQIHPARPAVTLSSEEVHRLLISMQTVIQLGIDLGGATIQNYKNVEDVRRVYAREGKGCLICGVPIMRIKQGGRSTFYCPNCQRI
jgi:formamidopyrimidine-DNA glycosylase